MAWNPYGEDFLGDKQFAKVLRKRRRQPPKLYQVEDVVGEEDRGGHVWENPELEAYLHHYREATTLGRGGTQEDEASILQYLKTAIYTALGEGSHRAGQYNTKASLTLPFPLGWVAGGSGQPETFSCHPSELSPALGIGWHKKHLKTSSAILVTGVRVTWGYRPVVRYDHSACPRCKHKRAERLRPSQCSPKV
ncbi:hypothetical protein Bbelb_158650 [Branchiostoma belcheri]|nr:hypothetical protein Bbelb_158650 [Branchiostoma belcheri]